MRRYFCAYCVAVIVLLCSAITAYTEKDSFIGSDFLFDTSWIPSAIEYDFDNNKKGSADGIITVKLDESEYAYTKATLYFADNTDILDEYLPIAEIALTNGRGTYAVSGSRGFPAEATRICTVISGDGLFDKKYWYTIPENKLFDESKPLFSFYCISDTHIGATYADNFAFNRQNAVNDILDNTPDFVVINGDLVETGISDNFKAQTEFLDTYFNSRNIPAFITVGNHEYYNEKSEFGGHDDTSLRNAFDSQMNALSDMGFTINCPEGKMYYSVTVKNRKFIFMGIPEVEEGVPYNWDVSESQLAFIESELEDANKNGNTVFLVSHVGLSGYIPGSNSTITNTPEMLKLLEKYPNTIMMTAHSHSDLSTREVDFVSVGNMVDTFTHMNDGCAIYLSKYNYTGNDKQLREYSAGQVIEVYSDRILIKSRKFAAESKFFGHGVFLIDVPENAFMNTEGIQTRATFDAESITGEYVYAVTALYDAEGRLLDSNIAKVLSEKSTVIECEFKRYSTAEYVKVFLFDDITCFSPVCTGKMIAIDKQG